MISDYEKLRQEQLKFLEYWNKSFVKPHREKDKHDHFRISDREVYALRVDDLIDFANKNKMTFELDYIMGGIIFKDIKR